LQKFSSREIEIMDCPTQGDANKLIARKFEIAEATVKVHIKAILRKIGVKNRTQAAIWAQDHVAGPVSAILDAAAGAVANDAAADLGPVSAGRNGGMHTD
jgi:two-component system nitrate/nitrite response regulator NarL